MAFNALAGSLAPVLSGVFHVCARGGVPPAAGVWERSCGVRAQALPGEAAQPRWAALDAGAGPPAARVRWLEH